ncbi:uncharacterized protein LOC62_06G008501 [Vanrija pseudolonga]|uniref:Uncharacterized protein n=1 Tax=Vanrija pseudolonga TaxID=143232 RepID=A0AAF0YDW5_9TREE|nr:hypothetical protein LOC62_06G008501 [Vanrija pseudolonga]
MSALARLKKQPAPAPSPPSSAGPPRPEKVTARNSGSASSASSSASASASKDKGRGKAPVSSDSRDASGSSTPTPEPRLGDDIPLERHDLLLASFERFFCRAVQCPLVIDDVECDAELASTRQLAGKLKRRPTFNVMWSDRSPNVPRDKKLQPFKDIETMRAELNALLMQESTRYCPVQNCKNSGPHKRVEAHITKSHKAGVSIGMLRQPRLPFKPELPELPPLPATAPSYLLSCPEARPNPGGTNTPHWTRTPKYPVNEQYPDEYILVPDPSILRLQHRKLLSSDIFPSKGDWDDDDDDLEVHSTPVKMGSIAPQRTPSRRLPAAAPVPSVSKYRSLPPLPTTSGRPVRLAAMEARAVQPRPAVWRIGHSDELLPAPSLSAKGKAPLRIVPASQRLEVRLVRLPDDVIPEARAAKAAAKETARIVAEGGEQAEAAMAAAQLNSGAPDITAPDRKGKRKMTTGDNNPASAKQARPSITAEDLEFAAAKFAFDKTGRQFGIDFAKHKDAFIQFHYLMVSTKMSDDTVQLANAGIQPIA